MPSRTPDSTMKRLARLLPALVAMLCVVLAPVSVACASAATPPACPMGGAGACCCAHGGDHALASDAGCTADAHAFTACSMRPADPSAAVPAGPALPVITAAILPESAAVVPPAPRLWWRPFAHVRSHAADASPPRLPSRAPPAFSA